MNLYCMLGRPHLCKHFNILSYLETHKNTPTNTYKYLGLVTCYYTGRGRQEPGATAQNQPLRSLLSISSLAKSEQLVSYS